MKPILSTTVWIIINSFKVVISGNLSFFATAIGRDGHSHCRCSYWNLILSLWKDSNSTDNQLSLSLPYKLIPKKIQKVSLWCHNLKLTPQYYIIPLLHLLIGIVNKGWSSMCVFFNKFVETISDTKASLKDKILLLETELQHLNGEIYTNC